MHRLRRGALLAAVAVVGALALSGCRSQPNVAVYVGHTSYSQQRVEKMASELEQRSPYKGGAARMTVAQWIVQRDVAKQMLTVRHIALPAVDLKDTAAKTKLPPGSELVKLFGEYQAYDGAIQQRATPTEPTPADLKELFNRAQTAGLVAKGSSQAAFTQGILAQNQELIASKIGIRNIYADGIKRGRVSVN